MSTFTFAGLPAAVGQRLGASRWFEVRQERIDLFAAAVEGEQWMHVDPERAASGPFGTTIAHGFLTLSLLSAMLDDLLEVENTGMAVNYGLDRVRFTAPVPVGSRLRGIGTLGAVTEVGSGLQATLNITVEIEGSIKPACVADWLVRYSPDAA